MRNKMEVIKDIVRITFDVEMNESMSFDICKRSNFKFIENTKEGDFCFSKDYLGKTCVVIENFYTGEITIADITNEHGKKLFKHISSLIRYEI